MNSMTRIVQWCLSLFFLFLFIPLNLSIFSPESAYAAPKQNHNIFSQLPFPAQSFISGALGRNGTVYQPKKAGNEYRLENRRHSLEGSFTREGVRVRVGDYQWGLSFKGYGYGGDLCLVEPVLPEVCANRVEYPRGIVREWYVNGPLGLEQGFTIEDKPGDVRDKSPLTLAFTMTGDLRASVDPGGRGITLTGLTGESVLCYRGLMAFDAGGKELRTWLQVRGKELLIQVEDRGARYPLTIDPFIQQAKLTASDGAPHDRFGGTVAISEDTIVVGAYYDDIGFNKDQGSAYVFVKPTGGWTNMTETVKLTASDGAANDNFGVSVAISGDTIVVGAYYDDIGFNKDQGSAYVFVKPSGGWANMTETAKLTASDGAANNNFGKSVAISGDTVVAGAIGDNSYQGSAYVFVKPSGGWANMTETAKLTSSDGAPNDYFGESVGLSGDTVVVGAYYDDIGANENQGSAYVFVKPIGGWTNMTETVKLTASDGAANDNFGESVGLSGDTVVAGAYCDDIGANENQGSAYVFVKPIEGWTNMTETAKLTSSDGAANDRFGKFVAISGDTVVVGAPVPTIPVAGKGSAYVFVKPSGGWANMTETARLTASDGATNDRFGKSVAISGDTVVVGAYRDDIGNNQDQGSAYVFQNSFHNSPSLYFWNGNEYAWRGSIFPGAYLKENEYRDYFSLSQFIPKDGEYLLQVREPERERSFIDVAYLIVTDRSSNAKGPESPNGDSMVEFRDGAFKAGGEDPIGSDGSIIRQFILFPSSANHSEHGDVRVELLYSDDRYVQMDPGQIITLTFPYFPEAGTERDFVFIVEGFYLSLE